MPSVELKDETFAALKALAEPFVDTPDSVIQRLLRAWHNAERVARPAPRVMRPDGEMITLAPESPGSLSFTRVYEAWLDGRPLERPNWNRILRATHVLAYRRLGSLDAVRRISNANLRMGDQETEGFRYVPEAGFAIQGLDANLAWENSFRVAKALEVGIEVGFRWSTRDEAAHPGKHGRLAWHPPRG